MSALQISARPTLESFFEIAYNFYIIRSVVPMLDTVFEIVRGHRA
jgi:hypothetical protein